MIINAFGRRGDVAEVTYRLVGAFADTAVEFAGASARVTLDLPPGSGTAVAIQVTTDHLGGPGGAAQRDGMARWLATAGLAGPGLDAAIALVPQLGISVSLTAPDDAGQETMDAMVEVAATVAGWVDGFVLAMAQGVVLGPDGAVWAEPGAAPAPVDLDLDRGLDAGGGDDPFVREARSVLRDEGLVDGGVVLDADLPDPAGPSVPPAHARIVRRLVVTAAVAARALTEIDGRNLDEARAALTAWVEELGAAPELERWEAEVLVAPAGEVGERDRIDGSWRCEAAAVLAWALGLFELPGPDESVDPGDLFPACGLASADHTEALVGDAVPRSADEIGQLRLRLLPGDGAVPADPEQAARARSRARERHRALDWLVTGGSFADPDVAS